METKECFGHFLDSIKEECNTCPLRMRCYLLVKDKEPVLEKEYCSYPYGRCRSCN